MRRKLDLAVLVALLLAPCVAVAQEASVRHFVTELSGRIVSVSVEQRTPQADGGWEITSRRDSRVRAERGSVRQRLERRWRQGPAGELRRFTQVLSEGDRRVIVTARRDDGTLRVQRRILRGQAMVGSDPETEFDPDGPLFLDIDGHVLTARDQLKVGGHLQGLVFSPAPLGLGRLQADVLGRRRLDSGRDAFLVEVRNAGTAEGAWQLLVDAEGRLLEMQLAPNLVKRAVPADEAVLPATPLDLAGGIPLLGRVSEPEAAQRVELLLPLSADASLPKDAYCRPLGATADGVRVALQATWPDGRLLPAGLDVEQRRLYTSADAVSQSDAPPIVALANELQDPRSPMRTAYGITRWVYHHLRKQPLDASQASAVEALRARAGDCTEHAALVVALSRASGLPARAVDGLVCEGRAMRFHRWCEIHIGNRWVPVDAALGRVGLPALYLPFGRSEIPSWAVALLTGGPARVLGRR